jgi:hypothetical protein
MSVDEDVVQYCRQATDTQLENILAKEHARYQHGDYDSACIAAAERGWRVHNGSRVS